MTTTSIMTQNVQELTINTKKFEVGDTICFLAPVTLTLMRKTRIKDGLNLEFRVSEALSITE
jgi:hypothetical protein